MTIRHDPARMRDIECFANVEHLDIGAIAGLSDPTLTGGCRRKVEALPERRLRKRRPHARCQPIVVTGS